ncbi:hypothetical protein [Metaclostridioides mangenotii]|uniref:hypothetical protein n=1 Tax=Metaclostridioides mangenotii TaxID=1540 RepID=UPI0026E966C1|nr:hypothetical protein [Clostridioides mangenotii]
MKDKNNNYEIDLCWLRIQAISKGREFIGEELHHKYPSDEIDAKDDLRLAYIEFNNSFDDLLKAEMKYLDGIKESEKRTKAKELIINGNAKDKDLEYLREVAEKEFRVYKHEKNKEPCVINISLNVDKDIDIETIANELVEKLKSEKNVSI